MTTKNTQTDVGRDIPADLIAYAHLARQGYRLVHRPCRGGVAPLSPGETQVHGSGYQGVYCDDGVCRPCALVYVPSRRE